MGLAARIGAGAILAGLAAPLLQTVAPLVPVRPLAGVEEQGPAPAPDARSWWDGRFQKEFEDWFTKRVGFRPWLVRTDNQLALTLFGTIRTGGTPVIAGREDWLFEASYVTRYARGLRVSAATLREAADDLARLRDLLARRRTALVVVIAPSKAEVYPDRLPPHLAAPGPAKRTTPYDGLVPLLEAEGIDLVDARRLFLERRRAGDRALLFARGGTHWNHYGAALVSGRILDAVERLRPGEVTTVEVTGTRVDDEVWTSDNDLGALLNVWEERRFAGPQTHPLLARRGAGRRPARLLFVGDSFSLTPIAFLTEEGLMEPGEDLYYFKRRIRYPGQSSTRLADRPFDVSADLGGLDAVVLVTNEYWLPRIGFGFVPAAISALEGEGDPHPRPGPPPPRE